MTSTLLDVWLCELWALLMIELVLHRLSGDACFELCTEVSPFSFAHLVLFRVGRPQKPAQFVNKPLAPFRGATSLLQKNI